MSKTKESAELKRFTTTRPAQPTPSKDRKLLSTPERNNTPE